MLVSHFSNPRHFLHSSPRRYSTRTPSHYRPYAAARLSHVVRDAQAEEDDGVIETPEDVQIIKVESRCLEKVVEFLKHYHEEPLTEIKTPLEENTFEGNVKQEWYQNFLKGIDQPMLFDLVTAANFMAIRKYIFLTVLLCFTIIILCAVSIISKYPPLRSSLPFIFLSEPLLDLTCLKVSCQLMGKTAEEIRQILNIPKLTREEEEVARRDHRWIFDD